MNVISWLEAAWSDFTFGLRQLRLNPSFTAVAVFSLALGIGANTAIFQLINAIRLRGLPVKEPSQLAAVDTVPGFFISGWYIGRNQAFTYAQLESLKKTRQLSRTSWLSEQPASISAPADSRALPRACM